MSELTSSDPFLLPLRHRLRHGLRRGALVGAYFFALAWLLSVFRVHGLHSERLMTQPVTAAATMIVGFTVAGGLLLAFGHRVRNVGGAIALGIVCFFPVWLGVVAALRSPTIATLPLVGVLSVLMGAIWGTMFWKGWYRKNAITVPPSNERRS